MEILNLALPAANRFATGYVSGNQRVLNFFHYNYNEASAYQQRLEELSGRTFYRQELADHIDRYMSKFPASEKIHENIAKLRDSRSVAVVGGQQAGLLTGPLYSVHKAISVIKLAEKKEKELGVPVVPVFWIAGEDHDLQEVNHVYILNQGRPEKSVYPETYSQKKMVSRQKLDKNACLSWIKDIIQSYGETAYTQGLLEFSIRALNQSSTFVDFFASIIVEMFGDSGLLLVDSGDAELRQLEKEYFAKQISEHEEIAQAVLEQQEKIKKEEFAPLIEIEPEAANLFYNDREGERHLLRFERSTGLFRGKHEEIALSKEGLLELASEHPDRLSNNVVTRPLMQEWLFPTIAFIGGPGEIAYWGELKKVFEIFGLKMPPLVPRLNITILDRAVNNDIAGLGLELPDILVNGTKEKREQFLKSHKDPEFDELFSKAKEDFSSQYSLIQKKLESFDQGMLPLLEKNRNWILRQIDFMNKKVDESSIRQHEDVLKKFHRVDHALRPGGDPQERVWTPFFYMNKYGLDFFSSLLELPLDFDGKHKVIKV